MSFLFETEYFSGEVVSSSEGEMKWFHKSQLSDEIIVDDLEELLEVMFSDELNEFQYTVENDCWNVIIK